MRKLVLWGHHVDEYQEMFDMTRADFNSSILEYGCGPSAINSELHKSNSHIVSCDPLFNLDKNKLINEVEQIFQKMVKRVEQDEEKFDFSSYGGLSGLIEKRKQGMKECFEDYNQGKEEKRYRSESGLELPFPDFTFDFALSSHYLFAALDNKDVDYYLQAIRELARVAKEVRIFPLVDRFGQLSPFVGPVLLGLQQENYGVEIREVAYRLQPKGNAMLRVCAQQCAVT
ncbi:SAM-dependent methyltransferase (plasmid) [Legionella adelaidensis]|uniref:Methyltransferase domain protein n=1 Tax=Legionella adelaidensis TaxID=45056 RepID=A0A0W0R3H2_9GAMM|nr:methyltransferase domain-containing protein [Legionella adelaidensis]KTC65580.1 Methyltransferase domain protein [Legionella adelaidensis]VEH85748.1 SAM-dependent methyltransferase [Legionella adelaidensis]